MEKFFLYNKKKVVHGCYLKTDVTAFIIDVTGFCVGFLFVVVILKKILRDGVVVDIPGLFAIFRTFHHVFHFRKTFFLHVEDFAQKCPNANFLYIHVELCYTHLRHIRYIHILIHIYNHIPVHINKN